MARRSHPRSRTRRGLGLRGRLLKPGSMPVADDDWPFGACCRCRAPQRTILAVLAGARRLARHGQIAEAVVAFQHAEALLDDPEFRRRCMVERIAAAVWLPNAAIPPMPAPYEIDPDSTLLRLSIQLRQLTRQIDDPDGSERPLVRGLARLLPGDRIAAARELRVADDTSGLASTTAWGSPAVRLAARVIDLIVEPEAVPPARSRRSCLAPMSTAGRGWPGLPAVCRPRCCSLPRPNRGAFLAQRN